MIETLGKKYELKTVSIEKDTWILELPGEICEKEGFAQGTLVSLTIKNSGIQASFIKPPSKKLHDISKRLLKKNHKLYNHKLYEELKRFGD